MEVEKFPNRRNKTNVSYVKLFNSLEHVWFVHIADDFVRIYEGEMASRAGWSIFLLSTTTVEPRRLLEPPRDWPFLQNPGFLTAVFL
ncbi:hypothetical protein PR048_001581 [Dryococelus australis]|uniref:Uncharacterized protein n=1 Tax=Dryococelus australis TaxID=614101 RepID=A0ABQ9IHS0_9NEOP|nr:hypothetical protein PR048_001581 [Dryococelus australis]